MHYITGRSAWHSTIFSSTVLVVIHQIVNSKLSKVEVTHQMNSQAVSQHHTGCWQHLCLSQSLYLCLRQALHLCLSQTLHLCLGWTLPLAQSLSSTRQARLAFQGWHYTNNSQTCRRHVPVDAAASRALCSRFGAQNLQSWCHYRLFFTFLLYYGRKRKCVFFNKA